MSEDCSGVVCPAPSLILLQPYALDDLAVAYTQAYGPPRG